MEHFTDLKRETAPAISRDVARVLAAVADHFTVVHPTENLEQHSLLIAFGAEAYKLNDRTLDGAAQTLAKAAFAFAPEMGDSITRAEYGLRIGKVLVEAGHDWPDGDNDRAIPRITGIPGPRTEPNPKPTVPAARPASKVGA